MEAQKESLLKKIYISTEFGFATTLSFLIGIYITYLFQAGMPIIGGLWVAISAIIVLQDTKDITLHFAFIRVIGSLIGSVVAGLVLAVFTINYYVTFLIVFLSVFICKITSFEEAMRLAALTSAIVIAVSLADPSVNYFINATARFVESCCGSLIAISIRYITHYGSIYLLKK